jgi:hypothetical protein
MTVGRADGAGTPFGAWLREHPELEARSNDLSATDSDMWLHKYRLRDEADNKHLAVDHLMLVEVKCFQKDVPYSQADTLGVIDLLLRKATVKNGRRWPTKIPDRRSGRPGATRSVRWLGVHVLQLSGDRPDNSTHILWDGHCHLYEEALVEVLRFDRDPDDPRSPLNTRRHHRRPAKELHPVLSIFSGGAA